MNLIKHRLQNRFLGDHWTQSFMLQCALPSDKCDWKTAASAANLLSVLMKRVTKEDQKSPALLSSLSHQVPCIELVNSVGRSSRRGKRQPTKSSQPWGTNLYKVFISSLSCILSDYTSCIR